MSSQHVEDRLRAVKSHLMVNHAGGEMMSSHTKGKERETFKRAADRMYFGYPPQKIPMFAVGYMGWKNLTTLQARLKDAPVDGLLVIDSEIFAASPKKMEISPLSLGKGMGPQVYRVQWATGPWALWGLLCCLHQVLHANQDDCTDFAKYAPPDELEFVIDPWTFLQKQKSSETEGSSATSPEPPKVPAAARLEGDSTEGKVK